MTPYTCNSTFINVILVYLLLFVSGAERYNLAANKYLVLVFLVALAAWFLFTDRKISDRYLLYMTVFVGLLFSLSLYTGGSLSLQSLLATTMKFVLAYLILRTVGVEFAEIYIKVMVFLASISLFGYLSDAFHLFDGLISKLPPVGERGYEGILYTFRHVYHPYRNNSIFFEPGAYQAFLNTALFLLVFARTHFGKGRKWIYIIILLTALMTALSTTGFLIFSVLFTLFLYRSELASLSQKIISVGLIVVVAAVFAAQFHAILVKKLDDYVNPNVERKGWSAENRSFDAQTDIKIFKEHVFGLGHDKYTQEFRRFGGFEAQANEGSSNGITSMFAGYGLPFALFIFISYFWALRKLLDDNLLAIAAYLMFLMFLWGESYYRDSPISFAIIAAAFIFTRSSLEEKLQDEAGTPEHG